MDDQLMLKFEVSPEEEILSLRRDNQDIKDSMSKMRRKLFRDLNEMNVILEEYNKTVELLKSELDRVKVCLEPSQLELQA